MKTKYFVTMFLGVFLTAVSAYSADSTDNSSDQGDQTQTQGKKKKKTDQNANANSTATASDEPQNNRAMTQAGSKSKWSGQLNLNYTGSSINHPFSEYSPNPTDASPPPVVTMSGTMAARYRINEKETFGLGTGIITQHPFQGPSGTTVSNPYVDLANSFKTGVIHHYLDVVVGLYTDEQNHIDLGYDESFTVADEMHYDWSFGLTTGLALELDANIFSGRPEYQSPVDERDQVLYDAVASPYLEFALNKTFNLRSVSNFMVNHVRTYDHSGGFFKYRHPHIDQTLGLGIAASRDVFLYTYIRMVPFPYSNVATDNTLFGISAIINLF